MAKIYTKKTWVDEVLAGEARYNILDDTGGDIHSNVQVNLATAVAIAGTAVDAETMNNIENGIDALDTLLDNVKSDVDVHDTLLTDAYLGGRTARLSIMNTSGVAAAVGDVGYIESDGTYKTTTTNARSTTWCIVIKGGANGTIIEVARAGVVTVNLNANCSAGNFLITSTTAGQAAVLTYIHWAVFAIALTANSAGAGGTCNALLLTNTVFMPITSIPAYWQSASHDNMESNNSLWRGIIASSGLSATNVPYTNGAGLTNVLPTSIPTYPYHTDAVLYNTTRGNYRTISYVTVNTSTTGTFTVRSSNDNWAAGDSITIESQTVVNAARDFMDIQLVLGLGTIPVLSRGVYLNGSKSDTGAVGQTFKIQDTSGFSVQKQFLYHNISSTIPGDFDLIIGLINGMVSICDQASGSGTATLLLNIKGAFVAVP